MATPSDVRRIAQALWERRYLAQLDSKKRQTLANMLQAEFYRRGWPTLKYRQRTSTDTHWITVGGTEGEHGEHEGGTPIQIDGLGRVHGGPPGLKGKTLGGGHEPPRAGSHEPPAEAKPKHAPELPKDAPPLVDTIGDRNAVADKHLDGALDKEPAPPMQLIGTMRSLLGTRSARKTGQVETGEIDDLVASDLHAYLKSKAKKGDGFGRIVPKEGGALAYVTPAGTLTVTPPAQQGGPWHAAYTSEDQTGHPEHQGPQKAPRKAQPPRAIKAVADDWGVDPTDLAGAWDHVYGEAVEAARQREESKTRARQAVGLYPGDISKIENAGYDYASFHKMPGRLGKIGEHFDEFAQEAARENPDLGIGDPNDPTADFAANLWNVIRQPREKLPTTDDNGLMRQAIEMVLNGQNYPTEAELAAMEPFARRGYVKKYQRDRRDALAQAFQAAFRRRGVRVAYAKGRKPATGQSGMFDESKVNRDESGEFARKGGASMANEPFALTNKPAKAAGPGNIKTKQTTLLSGLNSLPGQQDLFEGMDDQTAREAERKRQLSELAGMFQAEFDRR